ncbi:MAG TPA: hypothetical protein VJ183_04100 [Chloroflexia bacterium]|nr:hypothetical protein [Chloroflexia bacterium]
MRAAICSTLIVTLAVLALASGSGPIVAAPAAQPAVELLVTGGFGSDGSYLIGEWFPIRVTLTNPPGANSRRVRVTVDSIVDSPANNLITYSREVDLPAQSRKEITLYAYSASFTRSLNVRLLDGNAVIKSVDVSLAPYEQQANLLLGVISSDQSLLNALNGEGLGHTEYPPSLYSAPGLQPSTPARTAVLHIGLADIPPLSNALDSLDVIVVDDEDTGTLTAAQRESLAAWVGRGGMLVGLGRPGGGGALSALSDLLPVTLGNPVTLTGLASLGDLVATPITPTGQLLAPSATLRDLPDLSARTLAKQDGVPLVAMRDMGSGHVAYIGLSPAVAPLKGWDGTVPLFKRIVAEHPVRLSASASRRTSYSSYIYTSFGSSYGGSIFAYSGGLFDIPGLDLPSEGVLGLFLLVYIIIIGPVNFIILRRMKRGELAWITVPALVLLFSLGAYAVGYGVKGGNLLALNSNVVHTAPGLPQSPVDHFFGIFSPQRGTYSLESASDSTISEISSYGYGSGPENPALVTGGGDGGPTRLSNVNINTWSLRAFLSESAIAAESPLEADLHLGDGAIEGTVRNRSGVELQDVALVRGDETQLIGTLAPGQEAQARLNISQQPLSEGSPERLLQAPLGFAPSGPPYYGEQRISDAQRRYNRKVELLSTGLSDLLSTTAPTDMGVIALAWGPPVPGGFAVADRSPTSEDLNLWTAQLPVSAGADVGQPHVASVPFWVYAPANSEVWLDSTATHNSSLTINPYADLLASLPVGTYRSNADDIRLRVTESLLTSADMLVYNVVTGAWDRIDTLPAHNGTDLAFPIPNPRDHVGPAGDLTIRILSKDGSKLVGLPTLAFSLNEGR